MTKASGPSARRRPRGPHRGVANRLRHALGLRQILAIGGVRYREATTEPLRRALSRKGPGFKEYDVMFPGGGPPMRIRCTARRVYADLAPARLAAVCERAEHLLRPGMRVLLLEGGTGDTAAFVAGRVAPSGAVVALDRDQESIEFAQRRYRLPNASFEIGGIDGLTGETDGAFNAVIAVEALGPDDDADVVLRELWRVVSPGGWLMVAGESQGRIDEAVGRLAAVAASGEASSIASKVQDKWVTAVVVRPTEH